MQCQHKNEICSGQHAIKKARGLLVNLTQAHFSLSIVNVIDKKYVILVQRSLTSRSFAGAPEGQITWWEQYLKIEKLIRSQMENQKKRNSVEFWWGEVHIYFGAPKLCYFCLQFTPYNSWDLTIRPKPF